MEIAAYGLGINDSTVCGEVISLITVPLYFKIQAKLFLQDYWQSH